MVGIKFNAYCLLKAKDVMLLIGLGLNNDEIYSALYGSYLIEKNKFNKQTASIIRMLTRVAKKIVEVSNENI